MDITGNFSSMVDGFTCGYCGKQKIPKVRHAEAPGIDWDTVDFDAGELALQGFGIVECIHCHRLSLFVLEITSAQQLFLDEEDEQDWPHLLQEHPEVIWHKLFRLSKGNDRAEGAYVVMMYPDGQFPASPKLAWTVPEELGHDLIEAFNCLAIGAKNASVMMSRRVVQRIVVHFGGDKKDPLGRALTKLRADGHLTEELFHALLEVKNWGDGGAHPGKFEEIDLSEATTVAQLALILVESLFSPKQDATAIAAELKELRERKSE
jgi:hypothetical protein